MLPPAAVCSSLLLCSQPASPPGMGCCSLSSPSILRLQLVFHSVATHFQTSVKGRLKCFKLIQESLKIEVIHHLPHLCRMSLTSPQAALARSCFPILLLGLQGWCRAVPWSKWS